MVKQVQRLSWIWKAWRINRGGRWNQCNSITLTMDGTFIEWLLSDFSFSNLDLQPGADITDYFNYGFSEDTWAAYCNRSYYFGALSSPHFTFNDFSTWRISLSTPTHLISSQATPPSSEWVWRRSDRRQCYCDSGDKDSITWLDWRF